LQDHPLALIYAVSAAILTAVVATIATRVQLLPDVIDLTLIPTGSGLGSLALITYGAIRRAEPERIGRLSLLGTLIGGAATTGTIVIALLADVLS
jgi:Ca2+/Na+ antiporter